MPSAEIKTWLKAKRRNEIALSAGCFVIALAGGLLALLPEVFLIYWAAKLVVLLVAPTAAFVAAWSWGLTVIGTGLIYIDCIFSDREDMSVFPLWLFREFLHAGPRLTLDAGRQGFRVLRLVRLDLKTCANVLMYLANKTKSVPKAELLNAFPELVWTTLVDQLRLIEGVLFLRRDVSRLSLTSTLRLELRLFVIQAEPSGTFSEAPPPIPVNEPEKLDPCEILGVAPTASITEIKIAYRRRIKECHPDRFAGADASSRALAEEWTKALNAAYEIMLAQSKNATVTER